jgi:hypothetical protein
MLAARFGGMPWRILCLGNRREEKRFFSRAQIPRDWRLF